MEQKEKTIENFEERRALFCDKLKKHLTDEYAFFSEKKENLEGELLQLKTARKQKDRTLFPRAEKRDMRKYFSPLHLSEPDESQPEEDEQRLNETIAHREEEIALLEARLQEIEEFLQEIAFFART